MALIQAQEGIVQVMDSADITPATNVLSADTVALNGYRLTGVWLNITNIGGQGTLGIRIYIEHINSIDGLSYVHKGNNDTSKMFIAAHAGEKTAGRTRYLFTGTSSNEVPQFIKDYHTIQFGANLQDLVDTNEAWVVYASFVKD